MTDEEGWVRFVARGGDIFKSAGHLVSPAEVEAGVLEHPAVVDAGVWGREDELMGTVIEAHVVLAKGHSGDTLMTKILQDHVKSVIAPFKYPRRIVYRDALPKTQTGKIQRFRLRNEARGGTQ